MEALLSKNNDIPVNVLSRLPTKSLVELKFVCKEWKSLISDRYFVRVQLKREEPVVGIFFQQRFQWCDFDIDKIGYIPSEREGNQVKHTVLDFLPENVVIFNSCNGLICCRSCFPCRFPLIYVCNPLNKEWVSLQWPSHSKRNSIALAFDPFQDSIDVSTKFRVVRVCQTEIDADTKDCILSFDIYSSVTGRWRISKENCHCCHNLFKNKGIFMEGALYWLTDGDQVLMFDLDNELSCLVMVPLPTTQFQSISEMCIGESKGRLHYILVSEDGLLLWVLKDPFSSEWELKSSTTLDDLEEENSEFLYNIRHRVSSRLARDTSAWIDPLAFKDGLLFMRVLANFYSYDFATGKMKKLCDLSVLGTNYTSDPIVCPFSLSLVPLGA